MNKILPSFFVFVLFSFAIAAISINIACADDGIEYYGTISSINYNKKKFVADGRTFKARSYTEIEAEHGPYLRFCHLRIGHYVEVKGWPRPNYVDALEIEVKNYNGEDCKKSNKITVKGNISLIDTGTSTIVVKNETIKIIGRTKFKGNASGISELYLNQLVKVKGLRQPSGIIKAVRIRAW